MSVVLATWQAEIRRIVVPVLSGQQSLRNSHLKRKKLDVVVGTCHPSDGGKHKIGGSWSKLA
jgi:hypothetical protein